MKTMRVKIYGFVQGVGFRYFTKRLADSYKTLEGTIKNEMDGSVTVEVQGPEDTLYDFIEAIKKSPAPSGHVDHIEVAELDERRVYQGFRIIGY